MLGVNTSFATISFTSAPYARQSATVTYGIGAGDYQSRSDTYGSTGPVGNDLAGVNSFQGAPGAPGGFLNNTVGIGELITAQTGSTYGSKNDHSINVNTITMPLAGTTSNGDISVTMSILAGQLRASDGVTPVAPNDGTNTDVWVTTSTVFSDTFTWSNPAGNAQMITFDLTGRGIALALDQSYIVGFQWLSPGGNNTNALVIDRGPSVDPGGQYMGFTDPSVGWGTSAKIPFSAGAPRTAAIAINVPVPEPTTFVLLGLAVPGLAWAARRKS